MNRSTLLQPLYRAAAANRRWPECIIEWAVESLTRGVDTPSLRILAGLHSDSYESDVTAYYSSALAELGEIPPSQVERRLGVLRVVAREIIDGDVAPSDGVSRIHALVVSPLNHPPSLQRWCYLDDGLVAALGSNRVESVAGPALDAAIKALALEFLAADAEEQLRHLEVEADGGAT